MQISEEKPYGFVQPLKEENVLFIGDPHINIGLEYYNYEDIYDAIFKFAKENKKEYIIILGDIFDNILKVGSSDLKTFINILKNGLINYELKFILLTGNHDISGVKYNTKKNLYELYGWDLLWNVKTVLPGEIFRFNNFYFLPYFHHEEDLEKACLTIKKDIEKRGEEFEKY